MCETTNLKILLRALTAAAASARARSNASNLVAEMPTITVQIFVNADAVIAVLDDPNAQTDAITLMCPNTLKKIGREARAPLSAMPHGAVLMLATMQLEGWKYVRS